MNARFKQFGASFGSKRNSNRNNQNPQSSLIPSTNGGVNPTPTASTTSSASQPMNPAPQGGLGRPPSYTYNPHAPRSSSPLPPVTQQTMSHLPPPINTGAYPGGHPALGGAPQPPTYGGAYAQPNGIHNAPQPTLGQYGGGRQVVEVEGAGRSKAQLIVGIDFVGQAIMVIIYSRAHGGIGNYVLRRCVRFCDEYGSQRRYNYGMARCWKSNQTKSNYASRQPR